MASGRRVSASVAVLVMAAVSAGCSSSHARAQSRSDRCDPHALRITYDGGGLAAGNDFGALVLVNAAGRACRLIGGQLTVRPLDQRGDVIPTSPAWRSTVQLASLVFSGDGGPPAFRAATPPGDQWAEVLLGGDARDDPQSASGSCPAADEVTPAAWRVTGTLDATVANVDTAMLAHPVRGESPRLTACADPSLALTNVSIVQEP